jgi:hypothetical protein
MVHVDIRREPLAQEVVGHLLDLDRRHEVVLRVRKAGRVHLSEDQLLFFIELLDADDVLGLRSLEGMIELAHVALDQPHRPGIGSHFVRPRHLLPRVADGDYTREPASQQDVAINC